MRPKRPSISRQIPLVPAARPALRVELAAPQQRELIRALAELLLHAAGRATAQEGPRDGR